jgi:hypothetical protein
VDETGGYWAEWEIKNACRNLKQDSEKDGALGILIKVEGGH